LAAQFASHGRDEGPFERGYLAFVWGAPDRPRGTVDRPIDRHRTARDRMAIREGGREAVTHWQVAERYGGQKGEGGRSEGGRPGLPIASLLACQLETGRTHQIRVHLASIGHPLMGDDVYGPGFRTKSALLPQPAQAALADLGGQALHAYMLTIEHPLTGKILRFRSELPHELARLHAMLAAIRADSSDK
jgi:23S rRNA pseudouridine1911/1915/1917 synthase